ncbi:MAG: PAS domain S-box protein, partial [Campylobacteraceae bacterium]|nr:PAS domain S-box protein [Campylobacteraceae bacterium]
MDTLNQELNLEEFKDTILSESTLLYIEDNEEERNAALDVFTKIFKKVITAKDGVEATELFHKNTDQINIILTNMEMPNKNGLEFMKEVRKTNWDIPILACLELDNLSILPQVIKLKVADYIFKPIQCITALKLFHSILEQINHVQILEKQQQELSQFKSILDDQTLVSETDLSGKLIYVNAMFSKISGYTKDELVGQSHNIIKHPDVSPQIFQKLWDSIKNGKVWIGKIKNKAKDGSDYHVKATIFPILNSKGEIQKYMGSQYVITDEELEKQKLKKFIMSQRSEKIKSDQNQKELIKNEVEKAVAKITIQNLQKIEQLNITTEDIKKEMLRLRTIKEHASKRVISLEKEARDKEEKYEGLQKAYKLKMEKLHTATTQAYEKFDVVGKRNDALVEKFGKAQETISVMQTYIDEYRS